MKRTKVVLWSAVVAAGVSSLASPCGAQEGAKKSDSPWIFAGDLGVPSLDGDEFSVDLDVSAGYHPGGWGIDGRFASMTRTLSNPDAISSTGNTIFDLVGYYAWIDNPDALSWHFRAQLEHNNSNTTYIPLELDEDFNAESSGMTRLSGQVRLLSARGRRLTWSAMAGLGFQSEAYVQISSSEDDGGGFNAQSSTRLMAASEARYEIVPAAWALRARVRLGTYSIRRAAIFVGGEQDGGDAIVEATGLDVVTRLSAEWVSGAFFGLVPNAFVGADIISITSDDGDTSTFTPVFGMGLISLSLL